MKIKKSKLKQIIREELNKELHKEGIFDTVKGFFRRGSGASVSDESQPPQGETESEVDGPEIEILRKLFGKIDFKNMDNAIKNIDDFDLKQIDKQFTEVMRKLTGPGAREIANSVSSVFIDFVNKASAGADENVRRVANQIKRERPTIFDTTKKGKDSLWRKYDRVDLKGKDWSNQEKVKHVYVSCDFENLQAEETSFRHCYFINCEKFEKANFKKARFEECGFFNCNFASADFGGASFEFIKILSEPKDVMEFVSAEERDELDISPYKPSPFEKHSDGGVTIIERGGLGKSILRAPNKDAYMKSARNKKLYGGNEKLIEKAFNIHKDLFDDLFYKMFGFYL